MGYNDKEMIHIFRNISELSEHAAREFVRIANASIAERRRFLAALSGGNTPTKLYERLANEKLDWTRAHFFWGDERCVPADDAENSYGQAKKIFLDAIRAEHIHRVASDLEPDAAATDYARTLKQFAHPPLDWPRFDLVLLGMGDDGHTASLFPGSPVEVASPVIAVTANYQDRPANRVTLTPNVFNSARNIFFLVAGKSKARTLFSVLKGDYKPDLYPAQRIQPASGNLVWMVDEEAASFI